jgi:hypothetical protein
MQLEVFDLLGLVLAAMFGGAGLLMLFFGWLASMSGDKAGAGCLGIGVVLLTVAGLIGYLVIS